MTPPHQREKEMEEKWRKIKKCQYMLTGERLNPEGDGIQEYTNIETLAIILVDLQSRLDDLYKILTPSQRIDIQQNEESKH